MCVGMQDESFFRCCDERGLVPELVAFVGFALGDTGHLGFMEAVEFVFGLPFLFVKPPAPLQQSVRIGIEYDLELFRFTCHFPVNAPKPDPQFFKAAFFRLNCLVWLYRPYLISSRFSLPACSSDAV